MFEFLADIDISSPRYILTIIILIVLFLRLLYEIIVAIGLRKGKKSPAKTHKPNFPVSIIVCAKNESKNLQKHIPLLCKQNYPAFEVIVVNDASEDDSAYTLTKLEEKYTNLKHTEIPKDPKFDHGKKLALTIGIKAAQYDYFVLTDADCRPQSDQWLADMAKELTHYKIVLGYGGYARQKGLLNRLIRFDTLLIAKNYMSWAHIGLPYMGVGRNLAYHRAVYDEAGGFKKHYHLKTGDDDLLINQMATNNNTQINLNPEAFTRSIPQKSFRLWLLQKKRHLGAGKFYKISSQLLLGFEWILRGLTWPFLIIINFTLLCLYPYIQIFTLFYLIVLLSIWKFYMNKFHEKGFLFLVPFLEIFICILPIFIMTKHFIKRKESRWN